MAFAPIQVECSDRDLHSGVYGGSVHEAMTDLIALMGEYGFQSPLSDVREKLEWAYFPAVTAIWGIFVFFVSHFRLPNWPPPSPTHIPSKRSTCLIPASLPCFRSVSPNPSWSQDPPGSSGPRWPRVTRSWTQAATLPWTRFCPLSLGGLAPACLTCEWPQWGLPGLLRERGLAPPGPLGREAGRAPASPSVC